MEIIKIITITKIIENRVIMNSGPRYGNYGGYNYYGDYGKPKKNIKKFLDKKKVKKNLTRKSEKKD